MTPDSLMLTALAAFAISALSSLLLVWVASRPELDDHRPVREPRRHVRVLGREGGA